MVIRVEPEVSLMSKLPGWNQPKSSLSFAVSKASTVLVPHCQEMTVVVPPWTGVVVPPPVVVP